MLFAIFPPLFLPLSYSAPKSLWMGNVQSLPPQICLFLPRYPVELGQMISQKVSLMLYSRSQRGSQILRWPQGRFFFSFVLLWTIFITVYFVIIGDIPFDGRRFLREDPRPPPPMLISVCSSALKYNKGKLGHYPITVCGFLRKVFPDFW